MNLSYAYAQDKSNFIVIMLLKCFYLRFRFRCVRAEFTRHRIEYLRESRKQVLSFHNFIFIHFTQIFLSCFLRFIVKLVVHGLQNVQTSKSVPNIADRVLSQFMTSADVFRRVCKQFVQISRQTILQILQTVY